MNVNSLRIGDNEGWQGQTGTANLTVSGGTINSANQFQVGRHGAKGFVNQSGGVVNVNAGWFGIANDNPTSTGSSYALSGGALNLNNGVDAEIGADTAGSMTVSGSGVLNGSDLVHVGLRANGVGTLTITGGGTVNAANGVSLGTNANSSGTLNGNGGTIFAPTIGRGAGTAQFNANGVVFLARSGQTEFLPGLDSANTELQAGGLGVNTNGFNIGTAVGLDGVGGLTKTGAGTLTLSGANTYAGLTTISNGTVVVLGSVAGSVSVATGATLAGNGTITGSVAVAQNAVLSPGTSAGTLNTGGLTLLSSSTLVFELATAGVVGSNVNDLINVNGNLTLDGVLQIQPLAGFGPGTYRIFDYSGILTNNSLSLESSFLNAWPGSAISTSTNRQVNLTVVPEPAAGLTVLAGLGLLFGSRRRRA